MTDSYALSDRYRMLSREEIDLLKVCALSSLSSGRNVVVSVGAGAGTASVAILETVPQAFIFSLDRRAVPEEFATLKECAHDVTRVCRVLADTRHFQWPSLCPIDLLMLDGTHTDVGVQHDLEVFTPYLQPGSWVLVHDCYHPNLSNVGETVDAYLRAHGYEERTLVRFLLAYRKGEL